MTQLKSYLQAVLCLALLAITVSAQAAGYSTWAVPTQVDVERGNGFMVYGEFGNPNACTISHRFYVPKTHTQYKEIYSAVMAAMASGMSVRFYGSYCQPVTWYTDSSVTYNQLTNTETLGIRP